MDFIELVREFVVQNFLYGDGKELSHDASFLQNRIIDSTGVLELINWVEETFPIRVEDEEVIPENFDSVRSVSNYLESKLATVRKSVCAG